MIAETDIKRRVCITHIDGVDSGGARISKADTKRITPGIREDACFLVDVRRGVLDRHPDFHNSRLFHKAVDREREIVALRILGWIYPDIVVPFCEDGEGKRGVYLRYILGDVLNRRRKWTAQHKFDLGVMGVFDALVGNSDRHGYNAMVTSNHVYPIDHGAVFYGLLSERIGSAHYDVGWQDEDFVAGVNLALERVLQYADHIAALMAEFPSASNTKSGNIKLWAAKQLKNVAMQHEDAKINRDW